MIPLYQAEELARQRYESVLSQLQLTQDYERSVRHTRARKALRRVIEENIHSGASLGELKRELITVLHQASD